MRALRLSWLLLVLVAGPALGLDLRAQTEPLAAPLVKERVVGLVVGFYRRGEIQVLGFGEVEKGSGRTPEGNTVYEIGSVTKVFTGILLADRVLAGAMEIDAPLQRYLPDAVQVPVRDGRPITLRHLATHTAGLTRDPEFMRSHDKLNPFVGLTVEQLYASLARYAPRETPGRYAYSNFGLGLLGHVVTLQAGASYQELVIARICEPLGMHDTRPVATADMLARLAPPYDAGLVRVKNWDLPVLAGAGGMRSTANDMLKFIRANLGGDDTPTGRALRLSHQKLHTRDDGRGNAYGWQVSRSGQILFHGGSTGGYKAFLGVVPSQDAGVVVLANTAAKQGVHELGERLIPVVVRGAQL